MLWLRRRIFDSLFFYIFAFADIAHTPKRIINHTTTDNIIFNRIFDDDRWPQPSIGFPVTTIIVVSNNTGGSENY